MTRLNSLSVATPPGQIVFIVMPVSAKLNEMDLENAAKAALIEADKIMIEDGSIATDEEMLIKRPHLLLIILSENNFVSLTIGRNVCSNVFCHTASS